MAEILVTPICIRKIKQCLTVFCTWLFQCHKCNFSLTYFPNVASPSILIVSLWKFIFCPFCAITCCKHNIKAQINFFEFPIFWVPVITSPHDRKLCIHVTVSFWPQKNSWILLYICSSCKITSMPIAQVVWVIWPLDHLSSAPNTPFSQSITSDRQNTSFQNLKNTLLHSHIYTEGAYLVLGLGPVAVAVLLQLRKKGSGLTKINTTALEHFPTINHDKALNQPIENYAPVDREALWEYTKVGLHVFYEEELDIPPGLVLFNDLLDNVLCINRVFCQVQGHLLLIGPSCSGKVPPPVLSHSSS